MYKIELLSYYTSVIYSARVGNWFRILKTELLIENKISKPIKTPKRDTAFCTYSYNALPRVCAPQNCDPDGPTSPQFGEVCLFEILSEFFNISSVILLHSASLKSF